MRTTSSKSKEIIKVQSSKNSSPARGKENVEEENILSNSNKDETNLPTSTKGKEKVSFVE